MCVCVCVCFAGTCQQCWVVSRSLFYTRFQICSLRYVVSGEVEVRTVFSWYYVDAALICTCADMIYEIRVRVIRGMWLKY